MDKVLIFGSPQVTFSFMVKDGKWRNPKPIILCVLILCTKIKKNK